MPGTDDLVKLLADQYLLKGIPVPQEGQQQLRAQSSWPGLAEILSRYMPGQPDVMQRAQRALGSAMTNPDLAPAWLASSFVGGGRMSLAKQILGAIERAPNDHGYFGLRVEDGRSFAPREYLPDSRVWDDGVPTSDTINGVSTVGIGKAGRSPTLDDVENALEGTRSYHGDNIVLVGGRNHEYGHDSGEFILRPGQSLGTWKREESPTSDKP